MAARANGGAAEKAPVASGEAPAPQSEKVSPAALRDSAQNLYLVPLRDADAAGWSEKINSGALSQEDFMSWVTQQASALFPRFAKQIQAGLAPKLLLDPYRVIAQQELEREVSLGEPEMFVGLTAEKMPSLAEFRDYLRSLPEWDETSAAQRLAEEFAGRLRQPLDRDAGLDLPQGARVARMEEG